MTATPISILMEAAERGLKLGFKQPYTLTVEFAKPCLKDFLETLQEYKRQLLTLLQLPFCMVYSKVLKETIVFAEDEDAKATLVEAGAKPGSITRARNLRSWWKRKLVRMNCGSSTRPNKSLMERSLYQARMNCACSTRPNKVSTGRIARHDD